MSPPWAAWSVVALLEPAHTLHGVNGDWVACGATGCRSTSGAPVPDPCPIAEGCLARDGRATILRGALVVDGVPVPGGATAGPVSLCDDGTGVWLADDGGVRRWDGSWAAAGEGPAELLVCAPTGAWWRQRGVWHGDPPALLGHVRAAAGNAAGVWLVHDGLVGTTDGSAPERAWPLADAIVAVNGTRVAIAAGNQLWISPDGALPAAVVPPAAPPAPPPPDPAPQPATVRAPVGGPATPWNKRPDGSPPSRYEVSVDLGILAGSPLGSARGIGGSPYGAIGIVPHTGRVAWWTGLSSAPLFLQAGDVAVWPLAMIDVGSDIGGAHLRAGPYATLGLLAAGVGVRGRALPIRLPNGAWSGLEGRLTLWTGPDQGVDALADALVGSASLAWSGQFALGDRGPTSADAGPAWCARLGIGAGMVGGQSDASRSWERLGTDAPVQTSLSPAVTAFCETSGPVALWWAAETAPGFVWRAPDGDGDVLLRHWGSTSIGPSLGTEGLRAGPFATAGIWMAGVGGRLWASIPVGGTARPGLELRGLWLAPGGPAWQASAMGTLTFDPRR